MKKKLIFILFLLLFSIFYSQNSLNIYDFDSMKKICLENNLTLKSYENQMNIAKLAYDQALANLYLPSISINSSTNIPFDPTKNGSASINLNLSKPLFNGFTLRKSKDLAYLNYQYKKSLYENQVIQVKYLAFKYYYQYLVKVLEEKLYFDILKINEKRLKEYKTKYDLGLITELDFTSLALTFSKVAVSYENAKNEMQLAYLQLKNFANIKVDFELMEQKSINNIDFSLLFNDYQLDINNLKALDLLPSAKKYNVDYLASLYSYYQSEVNLKYYLASLFPSLSSSLGISYSGLIKDSGLDFNDPSLSISLSISFDLDSLLPFSSKGIEKKVLIQQLENAKINLLKTENDLLLNLETAIKNLALSQKNRENAENTYKYALKGYNLSIDAFNLGQISASEFASWEEEYVNAKITLYSSVLAYILNIKSLELMIGNID